MFKRVFSFAAAIMLVMMSALPAFAAPSGAVELTPGEAVNGSFDSPVDVDFYSISLESAGCVTVALSVPDGGEWCAALMDGSDNILCEIGSGRSPAIGLDAGTYYVRVTPVVYSSAQYSLRVNYSASSVYESELNDSITTADALTPGKKCHGVLAQAYDRDFYSFTLPDSYYISVSFTADTAAQSKAWGVTLLDGDMHELWYGSYADSANSDKFILEKGTYYIEVAAINYSAASYSIGVTAHPDAIVTRLYGDNRIGTAIEISRAGWTDGSAECAVIANAYNFPDALAGVPLASALDAPVLLTANSAQLEDSVKQELERLGVNKAYILGGSGVISDDIAAQLEQMSVTTERLAGNDRYGTAVETAKKIATIRPISAIYFASAYNFPDALSISPVAAASDGIILYMPASGSINETTAEYVCSCGCKTSIIVGGNGVVSDEGMASIEALGLTAERVYGNNRYETSVRICERFDSLFSGSAAALATGVYFPDALAGGVFAAKNDMPVVLVADPLSSATTEYFDELSPHRLYVFGGSGVVSDELVDKLAH